MTTNKMLPAATSMIWLLACAGIQVSGKAIGQDVTPNSNNTMIIPSQPTAGVPTSSPTDSTRGADFSDGAGSVSNQAPGSSEQPDRPKSRREVASRALFDIFKIPLLGSLFDEPELTPADYPFNLPTYYRDPPSGDPGPARYPRPAQGSPMRPDRRPGRPMIQQTPPLMGNSFGSGSNLFSDFLAMSHPSTRVRDAARLNMAQRIHNGFRTAGIAIPQFSMDESHQAPSLQHRQHGITSSQPTGIFDFLLQPLFALMRSFFPWMSSQNSPSTHSAPTAYQFLNPFFRPSTSNSDDDDESYDDDEDYDVEQEEEDDDDESFSHEQRLPPTGFLLGSRHVPARQPRPGVIHSLLEEIPARGNEVDVARRIGGGQQSIKHRFPAPGKK